MMSRFENRAPRSRRLATLVVGSAVLSGCARPGADVVVEDDHTHAGGGVVTLWTDSLELFVEYPPHVLDTPSEPWGIHLTWLADWKPVLEGSVTLLLRGPGGAREEIVLNAPSRPGVFTATPTLSATGTWRVDMTLSARGQEFAIPVGQLEVFESEQSLPHDVEVPPVDLIQLLKEQQWSMPFEVAVAAERDIPSSIPAAGEIVAPAAGMAHVSSPVAGLVMVRGASLAPGDPVRAGQTLALIAPTSIDNSYARLRADVQDLEREVARAERLFAAEAIAERRLDEARHDLSVAQAALSTVGDVREGDDPHTYRLTSPIGGVVSERHVAAGQRVEIGEHAFTIINPATVWFRARVPAGRVEAVAGVQGAWFTVEGGSRVHTADRLVSVGSIIDPDSRTLPVHFALANPDRLLKVGMLAEGRLLLGDPIRGVAVPTAAIQDEDGLSVVYVKVGGEAFQRRVLETGPSDGVWTIVYSGVGLGDQVVTVGAYQVRLASLGDAEISDHGHPH